MGEALRVDPTLGLGDSIPVIAPVIFAAGRDL